MAAGALTLFRANLDDLRLQDLTGAVIKLALVSSAYTPDASTTGHDEWVDVSANEIAAGNGYTAGGASLANDAVALVTNGHKYSSDNVQWAASGGNLPAWRYGVMYVSGTLWGKTNPLIGFFLGDNTPADVPATSAGNNLSINCPAGGWFDITQP